jgi:hypothetical protein
MLFAMKTVRTSEGFNAWYYVAGLVLCWLVLLVCLGILLILSGNGQLVVWAMMLGTEPLLVLLALFGFAAYALMGLASWLVRKKEP